MRTMPGRQAGSLNDMLTPLLAAIILNAISGYLLVPVASNLLLEGPLSTQVCAPKVQLVWAALCAGLGAAAAGAVTNAAYWPMPRSATLYWLAAWIAIALAQSALVANYAIACESGWHLAWAALALLPLAAGGLLTGVAISAGRRMRRE